MFIPIELSSPGKEKIVNENFSLQEAWNKGVIDRTLSSPPANPSSNGLYIPVGTATGTWAGKENKLLWWNSDGFWRSFDPTNGTKLLLQQEPAYYQFDGSEWVLERYQAAVYNGVADITALNAIADMIAGDHAEVLDSDGAGTLGWFIYAGTSWKQIS